MGLQAIFDSNGNATIQYHEVDNLKLAKGATLERARLGYCVYGQPDNPIVVLHPAVSGNPRAQAAQKGGYGAGWWNRHIGPQLPLDTEKYCIVCVSHLGGNGPSSDAIEIGRERLSLSIVDTSELAACALKDLGVKKVRAVVGVSIGAAIARSWLFQNHLNVERLVEIFGNFGNNFAAAEAREFFRIQMDLIQSQGLYLDTFSDRINANCGSLRGITRAFDLAYDHVMGQLETLKTDFSDNNVTRISRMVAFLRFASPYFFQKKWDDAYNIANDSDYANKELIRYYNHLGDSFVKHFSKHALASLCYMDAQPPTIDLGIFANALREKNVALMGLIVRGDCLYNSNLQFDHYAGIREVLAPHDTSLLRIHLCSSPLKGHDHFLSEEFTEEMQAIAGFIG